MTWDAYNRRKAVLREMLTIADRSDDLTINELLDTVDGAREAFASETEVLFDLQMVWFQRLSGQLDRLISEGADDPRTVAVTAWVNAAGEMPGARALLDAHQDMPELAKARAKEHAILAASAGVPANHPELTTQGRRLQDSAREAVVATESVARAEARCDNGLFARLRGALAA